MRRITGVLLILAATIFAGCAPAKVAGKLVFEGAELATSIAYAGVNVVTLGYADDYSAYMATVPTLRKSAPNDAVKYESEHIGEFLAYGGTGATYATREENFFWRNLSRYGLFVRQQYISKADCPGLGSVGQETCTVSKKLATAGRDLRSSGFSRDPFIAGEALYIRLGEESDAFSSPMAQPYKPCIVSYAKLKKDFYENKAQVHKWLKENWREASTSSVWQSGEALLAVSDIAAMDIKDSAWLSGAALFWDGPQNMDWAKFGIMQHVSRSVSAYDPETGLEVAVTRLPYTNRYHVAVQQRAKGLKISDYGKKANDGLWSLNLTKLGEGCTGTAKPEKEMVGRGIVSLEPGNLLCPLSTADRKYLQSLAADDIKGALKAVVAQRKEGNL